MRILVLEDERMLLEAIVEYLEAMGYFVDGVEDGEEAYRAIGEHHYDLFVFDINTPGMDGLSLLEKLQEERIFVPTIFISAITRIEQISKAYELGCYDYLKKPFHLKELRPAAEHRRYPSQNAGASEPHVCVRSGTAQAGL